ncbi:hypothetical protein N7520_004170 [Penicillium odoratum]|uniref:uncharacterized protein n=1 Tax=Penicillium odoratum TaxID=1167516 RepID=UPI0025476642|nr:uncharacterized protein N7520_004170 [Penicillium odoratum]KAJ5769611.1 hypothetical protein N7520_004170 [Penicillium odoratum]
MQFKLTFITALFAASAIAAPAPSSQASCSQSVVAALNGATKQVSDLNSNLSGAITAVSLVSAIITGFADNLSTLLNGIVLPCDFTLSAQDQQDICDAATSFINTDKALVSTLSSKASLLSGNILSINAHAAISNLETATTNYLRPVVSNMPICGGSVQSELKVLESDINSVVAAF